MSITLTPDAAKANARSLQERLRKSGHEVKLSLCYELMALSHGSPSWNALNGKITHLTALTPAEGDLSGLLEAARLERLDANSLVRAYDALAPQSLDEAATRQTLGAYEGETALYVPLGRTGGLDEPFIALMTGHSGSCETIETWTRRRWQMLCSDIRDRHVRTHFHPRSRFIESKLEKSALMAVGIDESDKAPRTATALRDALVRRVERQWMAHLRSHAPETLALAQATGTWDSEILPYLPAEDPIRAALDAGRYAWVHSEWYWPDHWGSSPQPWEGLRLASKWYADAASNSNMLVGGPGMLDDSLGYPSPPMVQPSIDSDARARSETSHNYSETVSLDIVLQTAPGLIDSEVGYFGHLCHLAPFTMMPRRLEQADLKGFTEAATRFAKAMEHEWLVHASHPFLHALGEKRRLDLFDTYPNIYHARMFSLRALYRMAADIGVPAALDYLASAVPHSFKDQDRGLDTLPLAPVARSHMDAVMTEAGIRTS